MVIVYVLAAVIVLIIVAMVFLSHLKMFKLTSTATGTVNRAEEREVRDDNERREETVLVCSYAVKGVDYQVEQILRGRRAGKYPLGLQLTVRYNPAQPEMAQITL